MIANCMGFTELCRLRLEILEKERSFNEVLLWLKELKMDNRIDMQLATRETIMLLVRMT